MVGNPQQLVQKFWNYCNILRDDGLSYGDYVGQEIQCGWLKDKYGLAWQIVPNEFLELLQGNDGAASERMMKAMFTMKKLDVAALKKAYTSK